MKHGVQEKWQKIYVNSPKSENIQEIISEVWKHQPSIADRKVETVINQFINGKVRFTYLTSKIDKIKPVLCETCSEKETIRNYTRVVI